MSERAGIPVTVWWGIPCKSAIPMFRSMVEDLGRDVRFIALNSLPAHRKRLGWDLPDAGAMELEVLGDHWQDRLDTVMSERKGLHIVNGIYHSDRVSYCARQLARGGHNFGVIMEAPSNLEVGIKRSLKAFLAPISIPLRTRAVARNAKFVLSASGSRQADFESLGFASERIYPFGYFPDFKPLERPEQDHTSLSILCIGYLEPFKGQDTLLRALAILKDRNVNFSCQITGYGSSEGALKTLKNDLALGDSVTFAGVVSSQRLIELFRASSVLVAPGLEEPWGIRINEALLSGLPVVVSDGIGAKELVETSGAGEVFSAGDPFSLADALQRGARRLRRVDAEKNELSLIELVSRYRERITPAAAGRYVAEVIDYTMTEVDLTARAASRPIPPWIDCAPKER